MCRKKGNKSNFVKIVRNKNGDVSVEKDKKLDGRGAYVCKNEKPAPPPPPKLASLLPRWFMERTLGKECDYKIWLRDTFGDSVANRIIADYYIGGVHDVH